METAENKFAIIHETLGKANNTLSVKMLCEIAGVSRSGYYNWDKVPIPEYSVLIPHL